MGAGASTNLAWEPSVLGPSANEIIKQIQSGARTCVEVVQASLDRIALLETSERPLNACVETLQESALDAARAVDAKVKNNQPLGPLEGLPIVVKINIDVKGSLTTASTAALKDWRPPSNAPSCTKDDILLSNSPDVLLAFASSKAWATRAAAWARGGFLPKALVSALENTPCLASNRTQFSRNLSRATHGGAFSGTSKMACGACTALRIEDVRFGCMWSSSMTSLSSPQMASRKEKSAIFSLRPLQ